MYGSLGTTSSQLRTFPFFQPRAHGIISHRLATLNSGLAVSHLLFKPFVVRHKVIHRLFHQLVHTPSR